MPGRVKCRCCIMNDRREDLHPPAEPAECGNSPARKRVSRLSGNGMRAGRERSQMQRKIIEGGAICSTAPNSIASMGIQWREPLVVPDGRAILLRITPSGTTIAGSMQRCADSLQTAVLHHGLDARVFAAPRCIHLCQFLRVAP